jgi:ABC-type antimicrobial peptide transport system permease subunit
VGRIFLIFRLAFADLRRRRAEAVMLLIAVVAATTTLSLGLVLHGVTAQPYRQTRAATKGPDVVATAFPSASGTPVYPAGLKAVAPLVRDPGVVAHSGPFPVAFPVLRANGRTDAVLAEGRDTTLAAVDQPELTQGTWVRRGAIVVERSFADALGIHAGQHVTLNGRPFRVAGIAVTAAFATNGLGYLEGSSRWPNPGLIWLTEPAAKIFATSAQPLGYVLNLKLGDPSQAEAFADRFTAGGNYHDNIGNPDLSPWEQISQQDGLLVRFEQNVLLTGSWLLALLAIGSLAILVGARMADQMRRVGLLKAVGSTPGLVAGVLLTEYLALALIAAAAGLIAGRLAAPLLTAPGSGLLGTAGAPSLTISTIAIVVAAAIAVAVLATLVPALRAARTSTIRALADAPRQPRHRSWLIRRSARLPVPLLLSIMVAARRPRRVILSALSIAVTVSGIVALLFAHATVTAAQAGAVADSANFDLFDVGFSSKTQREDQVLLVVSVMLIALATVNAIFITWATVQDSKHTSAVTRAIGAAPHQLTVGISAAQVLPALIGGLAGVAGGFGLFRAASQGGSVSQPPPWWLIVVVAGTVIAVAGLTTLPARLGARRPVAEILQSEAP